MNYSTKTHKRHERRVALGNKTPEQAIEAIRKAAEGLEGARVRWAGGYYATKPAVTGWTPLTPDEIAEKERQQERKKEADRKRRAAEKERAQAQREKAAVTRALAAAREQKETAETIARLLREQGYEIKKAPKGKVK